jgi:hypothetical protein
LATPVLVLATLLFGLGIGSAVFASLWQNEASDRRNAEQALVQERALSSSLERSPTQLQLGTQARRLRSSRRLPGSQRIGSR